MHNDVADLRDFYASPLGLVARRLVSTRIRARWRGPVRGTVIGLGYCPPYLGSFRGEADRIGALMPVMQGALVWPREGVKQAVLVEEDALPLADNSVDRLLVVHGLETAVSDTAVLREMWRVIAPDGRLMLVVPNRRGLWARLDRTPFGHGKPYSRRQLEDMLRAAQFSPLDWAEALYVPPFSRDTLLKTAVAWERMGARVAPGFAGVLIVEAAKELVTPIAVKRRIRVLPDLVPAQGRLVPGTGRCGG
ncbi:MAG: methyltransferase domain-containing protein [Hyphomicrobiaceae bacterium]|nr:methyltransferase domain-containing protein [Hyphomicrobiaceae bacterium]